MVEPKTRHPLADGLLPLSPPPSLTIPQPLANFFADGTASSAAVSQNAYDGVTAARLCELHNPRDTYDFSARSLEGILRSYGVRPGGCVLEIGSTHPYQDMKMASLLKGRMDVFEHFGDDISYWITWATQWDRQIKGKLMEAFPDIGISEDTTALRHGAPLPKSIKFPNGGKLHFFYDKFTPAQKLIGPGTYDCAIANFVSGSGIGSDDMVRAVLNVVKPDGAVILEDRGTRISPYFDELRHVLKAPGGGKVLKNKAKLEVPSFSQWGGEEMLCFGDWKPYLS